MLDAMIDHPKKDALAIKARDVSAVASVGVRGLLFRLGDWLFGSMPYPSEAKDRIAELAQKGTVVYVARAHSGLLGFYFNYVIARLGLPEARFIGGMWLLSWHPIARLCDLWRHRFYSVRRLLQNTLLARRAAFLFVRPQKDRSRSLHRYFCALIRAQRKLPTPVYVVAHVLVDRKQSGVVRGSLGRRLFGTGRRNGSLREIWTLLFSPAHAAVRVADAIDLSALIAAAPEADDTRLARRLAHLLNFKMDEEQRVIAGPKLPAFEATERHVMRSDIVRRAISEISTQDPTKTPAWLTRRARRLLKEIAARYNVNYLRVLAWSVGLVFNRIYDGIAVDEPGLARVLDAARKGPLVLCPSHKSHVDYLVLSYMLWHHDITPPHIAAGANLSFFPLGSIFRRAGAFFLRRSFRGDELYRAVFRAYVADLVRTGTSLECFIEGTRSRSGKIGMPKFGILGMVVDAWRSGARADVQLVPVAIDYERIIEANSYERELLGGDKQAEDIGALLRSTKVLRSRYGRVHVQFGEPISLAAIAEAHGLPQSDATVLDEPWRRATEKLGYKVLHAVSRVCTVTPTAVAATALLAHRGRGLAETSLLSIGEAILEFLDSAGARMSDLSLPGKVRGASLLTATKKLVSEGAVVVDRAGRNDSEPFYRVREEWRIRLDFHKNSLMNYFAPLAIVARAITSTTGNAHIKDELHERARFLSRLFKREFLFPVDADGSSPFDDALGAMASRSLLSVHADGTVVIHDAATIAHLASLLDNFVEGYFVTAETLIDLRSFPLWDKELSLRARERARRAFLEGRLQRPEASSRTLIDSALAYMQDAGIIMSRGEGRRRRVELLAPYEGEDLDAFIARIESFL